MSTTSSSERSRERSNGQITRHTRRACRSRWVDSTSRVQPAVFDMQQLLQVELCIAGGISRGVARAEAVEHIRVDFLGVGELSGAAAVDV